MLDLVWVKLWSLGDACGLLCQAKAQVSRARVLRMKAPLWVPAKGRTEDIGSWGCGMRGADSLASA